MGGPELVAADLERLIREPNDVRLWALMAALRRGETPETLSEWSGIDEFFLRKLLNIVDCERQLLQASQLTPALARRAKRLGFSDRQMGTLLDEMPDRIRDRRRDWNIRPTYKMVDTCAAEFEAVTPYFYGTFESENEAPALEGRKVVVLGLGPDPHRPGHRVRLLLGARGDVAARPRRPEHHDQLQSRDGQH